MRKFIVILGLMIVTANTFAQNKAIRIEEAGQDTPVLFLPGFISPGTVWKETFKNLEGKHKAYFVSYAGFNGIEPIPMPWYSALKKELVEYIITKKLEKIVLIGHSMGGNLAVDIAAELGDKIDRIVIVDALTCMREVMMPGVPVESFQYDNPYNNQMLNATDKAFQQTATMMAQGMTLDTSKQTLLKKWMIEADRKTYVYGYTDLLKLDLRPLLSSIKVPVLILGAPFPDKEVVLPNFEKQYVGLANKTIAIAPSGRHFIMFDQPQWLYAQINTFLSK